MSQNLPPNSAIPPDQQLALVQIQQQLARYEEALNRSALNDRGRQDDDDDIIDLRQLWNVLWRRRWTIFLTTLLIVAVAGIGTALMTPIYRATTVMQIELDSGNVLQFEDVQSEETVSSSKDFYQTQYELLKSRALAKRVIDLLGMQYQTDPDAKATASFVTSAKRALRQLFGMSDAPPSEDALPPDLEAQFLGALTVEPVRNSRLVRIHYESPVPQQAASIVNAVAGAFIDMNLERRFEASTYAKSFLEDRIKQVRADLEDSERRFQAYTQERGIVDSEDKQAILMTRLTTLNSALVTAETERIEAEAQYQEMLTASDTSIGRAMQSGGGQQLIDRLKETRVGLQQEYRELGRIYQPAYPKMQQLAEQIEQIDADIATEVAAIRDSIQLNYQAKLREEAKLLESIELAKAEILDLNARSTDFQALKREVDTNRELYDGLLQRMKEVGVAAGITTNNISVVDKALVPRGKFKPSVSRNLLLALVLGLFAGGGLALLFEMLDDSIKSTADLERLVDKPILGVTPKIADENLSDAQVALMSYLEPTSQLAEAMRSMRTALSFSSSEGAPRVLHFTSTSPGEGKTTTAINTAINFAQTGASVLLIDADLRNPSIHKIFNKANDVGLSNYLTGDTKPAQATQATGIDKLFVMNSGPIPPNPAELLHGAKMYDLVALAQERFDFVIIDGPPLLGLADAILLADVAKATLFVVAAHSARRGSLEAGMKRLMHSRANVLGMVLAKFDINRSGYGYGYGYGYSYNYAYHYSYGGAEAGESATDVSPGKAA